MPYSLKTMLRKERDIKIAALKREVRKEAIEVWDKAINFTYEELYKEAYKMYDKFIDQYYMYETKSYVRHGESRPGTGKGINLYRGQQIKYTPGFSPVVEIDFSGEDMERYQHNSSDQVLDMVMHGIRGVPSKGWWDTWSGFYDGSYFSYSGEMIKAFNTFERYFDDMAKTIFSKKMDSIHKSKKYKYF